MRRRVGRRESGLVSVQPGPPGGRREVEYRADDGLLGENLRMLLGSVVVEDRIDHLAGRHRALDRPSEADGAACSVPRPRR
jgi:hypothetical protein